MLVHTHLPPSAVSARSGYTAGFCTPAPTHNLSKTKHICLLWFPIRVINVLIAAEAAQGEQSEDLYD